MKYFQVLVQPKDCPWDKLLQVIDIVGMWHYTRNIPSKEYYNILYTDYRMSIWCERTKTRFIFYNDWGAAFTYTNENGVDDKGRPVEGTLTSALPYVEKLVELKLIALII